MDMVYENYENILFTSEPKILISISKNDDLY